MSLKEIVVKAGMVAMLGGGIGGMFYSWFKEQEILSKPPMRQLVNLYHDSHVIGKGMELYENAELRGLLFTAKKSIDAEIERMENLPEVKAGRDQMDNYLKQRVTCTALAIGGFGVLLWCYLPMKKDPTEQTS